jgi:putative SOS response-associated peptidase YedK
MCGRFTVVVDIAEIFAQYGFDYYQREEWKPNYNLSPSTEMPIATSNNIIKKPWGFQHKDNYVINIRSEGYFSKSDKFSPCLIPADGFFEWKNKEPFYFQLSEKSPFMFAGLCHNAGFAVLTKEASSDIKEIHHRMPIIISKKEAALNYLLNRDLPQNKIELTYKEVNPIVNNARNNSPLCISEVDKKQLRLF